MAEVNGPRRAARSDDQAPDPRALRLTLVPELRHADDEPVTIAPAAVPIRPRPDDLTAVGPLGGIAITTAEDTLDDPSSGAGPRPVVLLVNERAMTVRLGRGDAGHAVIELDASDDPVALSGPISSDSTGDARESAPGVGNHVEPETRTAGRQPVRRRVILGASARRPADGVLVREVIVDGWRFELEIESERRAALRERARRGHEAAGHAGPLEIRAIIPGRIVAISVAPGDAVEAGQQLLVLEAMKMQNELRAPREGEIERIAVSVGETVDVGNVLMVIS